LSGRVILWTNAYSITWFDNLRGTARIPNLLFAREEPVHEVDHT
jgi:hypothetical protein